MISAVGLLAIVAAIFMLLGHNWARRLALAWIGFHVVLGALNSIANAIPQVVIAVFGYLLLRRESGKYFLPARSQAKTPCH